MAQAWSILPLPRSKTLPLLLVKCQFENAAYTIHLTDLTYVWSETLDRRQIIRRALNDDTSIDPSEDAGQLKILLKKLEEALQGEQQTSLELESDVKDKSLLLNAVAPLPAPLRPLTWAIHLEPSSQETVTSELVLPSLNVQLMQRCQVSALLGQIKEKDHVIGRLLDKLESSGVELNSVFPGTAGYKHGKKGSERANAAKYVKGLGAFDEEQWSNETARSKPPVASQQELVQEVFKTREMETLPKTDSIAYVEPLRSWWTTLNNRPNSSTRSMVNGRVAFSAGHGDSTMDENRTSQLSDKYGDGFQRQATPPRPESSTRQIAPVTTLTAPKSASNIQTISPQHDDEATDEEEDIGSKPQEPIRNKAATHLTPLTRSPPASPTLVDDLSKKSAVTANSRNRLGAIGGSSVKTASPGPDKSSGNSTTSPAAEVQDPLSSKDSSPVRTASNEGHHDQHRSPISSASRGSASRGSASRGRLGIIGGKKRGYIAPETIIPSAETSLPLLPSKAHGRLGTIGGRGKEQPKSKDHLEQPLATEIPNVADFSGGPAPFATTQSVSKDPSPTAETAQEKADRKREELKRQLEKKASAPVKRQRRF